MNCGKWTSTNANSVYAVNLIDSSALTTMSGTFGAWIQNYNTVAPSSLSTVLYNLVPGATYNIRYLQGSRGLYFVGQAAFSSLPAAVSSYTLPL